MCVFVCVRVCLYLYVFVFVHVHGHVYVHLCVFVCDFVSTCLCVNDVLSEIRTTVESYWQIVLLFYYCFSNQFEDHIMLIYIKHIQGTPHQTHNPYHITF